MYNDDERDYEEEAYNRALLQEEDQWPDGYETDNSVYTQWETDISPEPVGIGSLGETAVEWDISSQPSEDGAYKPHWAYARIRYEQHKVLDSGTIAQVWTETVIV